MLVPEGCHRGEHQCCAVGAAWAGGVSDPWGRDWGVCARVAAAGTKAGGISSEYRGDGKGMQWDVIAPLESASTVTQVASTVWHSIRFTFASYWKIEPFFIEK